MAQHTKKKKGPAKTPKEAPIEKSNENNSPSNKPQKPNADDKSKRNNGIWDRMDKVLK